MEVACPACTLLNSADAIVCEACNYHLPPPQHIKRCPHCSYDNKNEEAIVCSMCHRSLSAEEKACPICCEAEDLVYIEECSCKACSGCHITWIKACVRNGAGAMVRRQMRCLSAAEGVENGNGKACALDSFKALIIPR